MDRWTKKQLEEMNDLDFAICILTERRNKVSPLGKQCWHLQKNEQHEYWKQRELAKARKEK